jgi:hypothetical protein
MDTQIWSDLIGSLFDWHGIKGSKQVPGTCLNEWLELVRFDYDEYDRFLIDQESNGGG